MGPVVYHGSYGGGVGWPGASGGSVVDPVARRRSVWLRARDFVPHGGTAGENPPRLVTLLLPGGESIEALEFLRPTWSGSQARAFVPAPPNWDGGRVDATIFCTQDSGADSGLDLGFIFGFHAFAPGDSLDSATAGGGSISCLGVAAFCLAVSSTIQVWPGGAFCPLWLAHVYGGWSAATRDTFFLGARLDFQVA